jgi:large subunit ribosomal protein L4
MTVDVVNQQNEKVGSVDLRDEVFGGRVKTDLIHASVVRSNAADRRGTHATKNRALVSGSGKKPWRQKGTGRARVGEIRNPLWRGGGTVFGPQPRSYDYQLPKKVEKGALRAALAQKLQAGEVTVVDALTVADVKTKAAVEMLRRLGVEGGRKGKALIVDVKPEDKLALSVRNIEGVRLLASNRIVAATWPARAAWCSRAPRSRSCRKCWDNADEDHRRHSQAPDHRKDDRSSARTAARSCSRWRWAPTRSTSSAPSSSCSDRRLRAFVRRSRTAR